MANLIAIAYDDEATARQVMDALAHLQAEDSIDLEDMVMATHDDKGKVKLHQPSPATMRAAGGALWGGVIGRLFLAPFLGMALGSAAGIGGAQMTDIGVADDFFKELGEKLQSGGAAVIVLEHQATPDKVLDEVGKYGGHVVQSSLSHEREAELQAALDARAATA
jgi:uncharacterized membrane protein